MPICHGDRLSLMLTVESIHIYITISDVTITKLYYTLFVLFSYTAENYLCVKMKCGLRHIKKIV